jgi:hypothetical protein
MPGLNSGIAEADVNDWSAASLGPWRYGMHPRANGSPVRSLERVELPLGESLRLEMDGSEPGAEDAVHLQYYIVTSAGPWALWISCPRADLPRHEATLRTIAVPVEEGA